jgi:hypothetical protein
MNNGFVTGKRKMSVYKSCFMRKASHIPSNSLDAIGPRRYLDLKDTPMIVGVKKDIITLVASLG